MDSRKTLVYSADRLRPVVRSWEGAVVGAVVTGLVTDRLPRTCWKLTRLERLPAYWQYVFKDCALSTKNSRMLSQHQANNRSYFANQRSMRADGST